MRKKPVALLETHPSQVTRANKQGSETQEALRGLAQRMVQRYIQDLLSTDELVELIEQAWQESMPEEAPGDVTLETLARGLCSQALWQACQSIEEHRRNLAFERLGAYLERALGDIGGTVRSAAREVREEIIQETLVEILKSLQRERGRPEQPLAFLGWARVILQRQVTRYWRQKPRLELPSLEQEDQSRLAELIDEHTLDPLLVMLQHEKRTDLHTAIASLRNPNYREVLLQTYFHEREAREIAEHLCASINEIYLWHHRALQALHKQLTGGRKPHSLHGKTLLQKFSSSSHM
jgi:RNA polymerase sigma factor (sigma-70 family)